MEQQVSIQPTELEKPILGWLEALLFAAGDAVATRDLAAVVGLTQTETRAYLNALQAAYRDESRGLRLIEVEDTWQLSTKPALFDLIKSLNPYERQVHLSRAALETLSIIAYRQPVTRVDIEQIRGVASASSIKSLLDNDLIMEAGRKDAPGRPFFYKTTDTFLKAAGIGTLTELPPVEQFEAAETEAPA